MDRNTAALRRFGQRLTAIRQQKDLSIQQLAAASGLEDHLIEQIEAGKADLLFTTLLALSKGLEINPDQLLDG